MLEGAQGGGMLEEEGQRYQVMEPCTLNPKP